ncbi:MAG: hypothetical protein NTZ35_18805 [Ignavibacteriales bacterium]|nr:hypothetical protein [Ignavibacteriales bacterium]
MKRATPLGRSLTRGCVALLLTIGAIQQPAVSQDRTFSITGSAGYSLLSLGAVDDKNASDVVGWSNLGIPVSDFASVKQSPFFSGRLSYRFSREIAFSIYGSSFSKSVSSSYDGPDAVLQLERSVGATDLSLGVAYYPAVQPYFLQWYLQVNLGVILARASTKAFGTQNTKPTDVGFVSPLVDSEGKYRKTKPCAAFSVGANMPLYLGIFLKGEAGYQSAQVGQLDGDITQSGVHSNETSTTFFDFSGFIVSVGVGIEL